jgi:tetratricopeptide (TPR) repeat protein
MYALSILLWLFLLTPMAASSGDEKDGWKLMRQRDYAAALKRFEKDASEYRKWAELQDAMGWCHYFLEDYEEAETCFRKALELKPDYKWSVEGLEALDAQRRAPIELADSLLAAGRYPEARAAYRLIHEGKTAVDPAVKIAALIGEGWSLYYTGLFREATKCFRSAHKKNRDGADALRGMAYCDYAQEEYRRALTSLRLALELEPAHYVSRLTAGWSLYFMEDFDSALAEFKIAEQLTADSWGAWSGIGWCHVRTDAHADALSAFSSGLEISPYVKTAELAPLIEGDPAWRILHNVAGWSALRADLTSWALAEFQAAAALECDIPEALSGQAFAFFRMERYAEAQAALDAGAANGEHSFPVTLDDGSRAEISMNISSLKGWIAHRQGRYDEALGLFRAIREEHPTWVDPVCGEGWALYVQGNYPAAEEAFDTALELQPGYSDAISGATAISSWRYADYNRGWTALLAGDTETARRGFEGILEDSRSPYPRTRLDLVEASLGWTAFRNGDEKEAEKRFENALRITPGLGLAQQGWGYMELAGERWESARRHLVPAIEAPELASDAELRVALGRCLLELNRARLAKVLFEKAIELDPAYAAAHSGLAMYYLRNNEDVAARLALERAFSLDPTLSSDPEIADKMAEVKEFVKLHSTLGWAWFYRGDNEFAERHFRVSIEKDPLEATARNGLGLSLLRQGELKEGSRILEAWLNDAPRYEALWGVYSSTLSELGWTFYREQKYRDALRTFRKLEALHKGQVQQYADPLDGQAWCLLRLRSERPARAKFEEALEVSADYASSLAGLAEMDGAR